MEKSSSKAEARRLRREQYFEEKEERRAEYADEQTESTRMFSAGTSVRDLTVDENGSTENDHHHVDTINGSDIKINDDPLLPQKDEGVGKTSKAEQYHFKEQDERRVEYADEHSESARMFDASTTDVAEDGSLSANNDAENGDATVGDDEDAENDDEADTGTGRPKLETLKRADPSRRATTGTMEDNNGEVLLRQLSRQTACRSYGESRVASVRCERVQLTLTISSMPSELKWSATRVKCQDWMQTFYHLDPRRQILRFFNDVAREGVNGLEKAGKIDSERLLQLPIIARNLRKVGVFSVWRPTSNDAIRKMMTGEGTGKGLDIKGKSAQRGKFSGFVPYLQISDNAHKKEVCARTADGRVRIFYPNEECRDKAIAILGVLKNETVKKLRAANDIIRKTVDKERGVLRDEIESYRIRSVKELNTEPLYEGAMKIIQNSKRRLVMGLVDYDKFEKALEESLGLDMANPRIYRIDEHASTQGVYGLDIPEKLFWQAYVEPFDITVEEGGEYDTGRPSMPEFQEMNMRTLRKKKEDQPRLEQVTDPDPIPVLWHGSCGAIGEEPINDCDPMDPRGLLMAYEEEKKVTPVVSDFDCSLFGTRGVPYVKPFREEEMAMLTSCIDKIEEILSTPEKDKSWTQRWLDLKKKGPGSKDSGEMPKYGYADPRSYAIIQGAVHRLRNNGAVRHGPECFNFSFPQAQDKADLFLVISDTLPGKVPWKYVDAKELIDILCEKVDEGFTFPLNPKWILADHGWKRVYDKLLASDLPHVQDSMNTWYPPHIRERIACISEEHPLGFIDSWKERRTYRRTGEMEMNMAELQLDRQKSYRSAISKVRKAIFTQNEMKVKCGTFFSSALHLMKHAKEEGRNLSASTRRSSLLRSTFRPDILANSLEGDADLNGTFGPNVFQHTGVFNSMKLSIATEDVDRRRIAASRNFATSNHPYDDTESDGSELERMLSDDDDSCQPKEPNYNSVRDSNGMTIIENNVQASKCSIRKNDQNKSCSDISLTGSGSSECHSQRVTVSNDSGQSIGQRDNWSKNPGRPLDASEQMLDMSLQSFDPEPDECSDGSSLHTSDATNSSKRSGRTSRRPSRLGIKKSMRKSLKVLARKLSST